MFFFCWLSFSLCSDILRLTDFTKLLCLSLKIAVSMGSVALCLLYNVSPDGADQRRTSAAPRHDGGNGI